MKYWLGFILIPLLVGCKSTIPSESIANSVIKDLKAHEQAIVNLEKQTPKECKTDAFVATIDALKGQTESIEGQVKSISQACKTEKVVLEQKITIRDIFIGILVFLLAGLGFLFVRFKR